MSDADTHSAGRNHKPSDQEGPSGCVVFVCLGVLGLFAGAVFSTVLYEAMYFLSWLLPLRKPWPDVYYARVEYTILLFSTLIDAGMLRIMRRQSKAFVIMFALGAVCINLFFGFLTFIGLDGSWYIP